MRPQVQSVSSYILLISAHEGGWPGFYLTILSFQRHNVISILITELTRSADGAEIFNQISVQDYGEIELVANRIHQVVIIMGRKIQYHSHHNHVHHHVTSIPTSVNNSANIIISTVIVMNIAHNRHHHH